MEEKKTEITRKQFLNQRKPKYSRKKELTFIKATTSQIRTDTLKKKKITQTN